MCPGWHVCQPGHMRMLKYAKSGRMAGRGSIRILPSGGAVRSMPDGSKPTKDFPCHIQTGVCQCGTASRQGRRQWNQSCDEGSLLLLDPSGVCGVAYFNCTTLVVLLATDLRFAGSEPSAWACQDLSSGHDTCQPHSVPGTLKSTIGVELSASGSVVA